MIVQWGNWKIRVEEIESPDGMVYVAVCENCVKGLINPLNPIPANETGYFYCSHDCAKEDVIAVAKRLKEENPEWSGF